MSRRGWLAGLLLLLAPVAAQAQGESIEYYATDAVGSVRVVFDANGAIIGRMDYGPFGEDLGPAARVPDQRFAGLFRDGEAGLDYAQARSYQPRTGRFTAPDPVFGDLPSPQRWNRYAYALNRPASLTDPTGEFPTVCISCVASLLQVPGSSTASRSELELYPSLVSKNRQTPDGERSHGKLVPGTLRIADTALSERGSEDYLTSKAKGNFDAGANKCNLFCADVIEESGLPRPQVPRGDQLGWFGVTRDPTAHEWADPNVDIPGWSSPKPLSKAMPGDVIAQAHGPIYGHVGIVVAWGLTASVNTAATPSGIITVNNWGFRAAPGNGEGPHDPPPVVRTYIGRRR